MPTYTYKAITPSGSQTRGRIEASNIEQAENNLAAKNFIPTSIVLAKKQHNLLLLQELFQPKVKTADLILFTKQLKTLLHAGVPIIKSLEILQTQTESKTLSSALTDMVEGIRKGMPLHKAFQKHPRIFSSLYCNMLEAGEQSGNITEVLNRISYIIQHEYKVHKDIMSAMTYPAIVLFMLFASFIFLLTTVVPKFVNIFAAANIELPWPTQVCLVLYNALDAYWYIILGVLAIVVIAATLFLKTPKGRLLYDTSILGLPILGNVFRKAAMARFASIFSIMHASGLSIMRTIHIVSGTLGNTAIAQELDKLQEQIQEGQGIAVPLRHSRYFPPMVVNMIAIGEESGNLETMLQEVSDHYDYEVAHAINRMSELLSPVLIICMAFVVGFFALAIFMPMWDLMKLAQ